MSIALGDPALGLLVGLGFGVGRTLPVVLLAPLAGTERGADAHAAMAERPGDPARAARRRRRRAGRLRRRAVGRARAGRDRVRRPRHRPERRRRGSSPSRSPAPAASSPGRARAQRRARPAPGRRRRPASPGSATGPSRSARRPTPPTSSRCRRRPTRSPSRPAGSPGARDERRPRRAVRVAAAARRRRPRARVAPRRPARDARPPVARRRPAAVPRRRRGAQPDRPDPARQRPPQHAAHAPRARCCSTRPATARRLLYVRSTFQRQQLRIGAAAAPAGAPRPLALRHRARPAAATPGYEPGVEHHAHGHPEKLPPRPPRNVSLTLWSTALGPRLRVRDAAAPERGPARARHAAARAPLSSRVGPSHQSFAGEAR